MRSAHPIVVDLTPAAVPVDAVIVTPGYVGVMQPSIANAHALTRQQIETVPQLGEDVYRTIGRLPGVATDDFSANFNVRGEPSQSLYVTLDGVPLVEPFHLRDIGNALSIVDLAVARPRGADHRRAVGRVRRPDRGRVQSAQRRAASGSGAHVGRNQPDQRASDVAGRFRRTARARG